MFQRQQTEPVRHFILLKILSLSFSGLTVKSEGQPHDVPPAAGGIVHLMRHIVSLFTDTRLHRPRLHFTAGLHLPSYLWVDQQGLDWISCHLIRCWSGGVQTVTGVSWLLSVQTDQQGESHDV